MRQSLHNQMLRLLPRKGLLFFEVRRMSRLSQPTPRHLQRKHLHQVRLRNNQRTSLHSCQKNTGLRYQIQPSSDQSVGSRSFKWHLLRSRALKLWREARERGEELFRIDSHTERIQKALLVQALEEGQLFRVRKDSISDALRVREDVRFGHKHSLLPRATGVNRRL